jgi:hypothetical protein
MAERGGVYICTMPWPTSPSINGVHPAHFQLIGGRVRENQVKGLILSLRVVYICTIHWPTSPFINGVHPAHYQLIGGKGHDNQVKGFY